MQDGVKKIVLSDEEFFLIENGSCDVNEMGNDEKVILLPRVETDSNNKKCSHEV
jgi:hypothetical protein